eukprot:2961793-Pyramimonas_sp.AAC.1
MVQHGVEANGKLGYGGGRARERPSTVPSRSRPAVSPSTHPSHSEASPWRGQKLSSPVSL